MLEKEFLSFEKELKSYLYRLLTNKEDVEDIVQDTYLKASAHFKTFEGKSSIKTWVFRIATNLAKDFLKKRNRWCIEAQDKCRDKTLASEKIQQDMGMITQTSLSGKYEIREHIDFCFTCMSKTLKIEHQIVLILKDIYEFKLKEIAQILQKREGAIKHYLRDARLTMTRIFENRCSLINKEGMCHQCTELNGIFNPEQQAQQVFLLGESQKQDQSVLYELRTQLVQHIQPLEGEGTDLHEYMFGILNEQEG